MIYVARPVLCLNVLPENINLGTPICAMVPGNAIRPSPVRLRSHRIGDVSWVAIPQVGLHGSQIPKLISPNTAVKSKQRYLWFYWEQTYYHRKLLCCSVSLLPQTFFLKLFTPIWTKGFWNSFKLHYKKVSDWLFRYFSWYFHGLQGRIQGPVLNTENTSGN